MIGTNDPLLDDSLLMASRLTDAETQAELHLETAAAHGFTSSPGPASDRARAAIHQWIRDHIATID